MKHTKHSLIAAFLGLFTAISANAEQVIFTEIMYNPVGTKPEYIELKNISFNSRDIAKWRFDKGITYEFPDFNVGSTQAHILVPQEKIIVSSSDPATTRAAYPWIPAQQRVFGPWTGSLANSGENINLTDKNGTQQATIDYKNSGRWPVAADGTGHSLMIINENSDPDDWHNWTASPLSRGSVTTVTTPVLMNHSWKYFYANNSIPSGWDDVGYGEPGWNAGGPAPLGFESGNANVTIATTTNALQASNNNIFLFRTTFQFNGSNPNSATVAIDQMVDDGVTYYLNGTKLGSVRHVEGDLLASDLGTVEGFNGDVTGIQTNALVVSGGTNLQVGTNVLAASVHQGSNTSSDVVFAAKVTITEGGAAISAPLRLSEVHFDATGNVDWVELQNTGGSIQSTTGLYLSSKSSFSDKVALTGNVAANGYQSFSIPNGGFETDNNGNFNLYLIDGANNVLGAADLTRVTGRDSLQAVWPVLPSSKPTWELLKTKEEWFSATTSTQNAANAPVITTSIVINEIMNDPISEQDQAEYIELYNKTGSPVSIAGWKLRGGVDYDFPAGTSVPANGYLIVGGNKAFLQSVYGGNPVGDWSGKLANKGEYIRLEDAFNNLADEVDFKVGGDWPDPGVYRGSSLELIHPDMDNNRASAWRASDETNKTTFATYRLTGTYLDYFRSVPWNVQTRPSDAAHYKELQFFATKDAHVIIKNVKVTTDPNGGGTNLINGNMSQLSTNGLSNNGWLCQGTHAASYMDAEGLHILADGHGDQRPNHVEIDCTNISAGNTYTISFDARWVSGTQRLVSTLWDRTVGGGVLLAVPNNLGTAGAVNSQRTRDFAAPSHANPPAQVDSLTHSPAVPKPNESIKVTARVFSATANPTVELRYGVDSISQNITYTNQVMVDNGTNGDVVSGDGVYTGTIPAQNVNNRRMRFYVKATAANGNPTYQPQTGSTRPAMLITDDRTHPTDLRRQRFVVSEYEIEQMRVRGPGENGGTQGVNNAGLALPPGYKYARLSNHYFPMTFINNESEIYYLAETHQGGSNWHRPYGAATLSANKWKLPDDRAFRRQTKMSTDDDININDRLLGYLLYTLGYPASYDEEHVYFINPISHSRDVRRGMDLIENELLDRAFADGAQGELYEVCEDRISFDFGFHNYEGDTFALSDWTHKGNAPIRYTVEHPLRNRDYIWDYSPLISMFQIVSDVNSSRDLIDRTIDVDAMMREQAVRAVCGDYDSQFNMGKNGYLYRRPSDGRMVPLFWDGEATFSPNDGFNPMIGGQTRPSPGAIDNSPGSNESLRPVYGSYANKPWVRRAVNYYFTELIDKHTKNTTESPRTHAWFTAQENSSAAWAINNVNNYWNFWSARRSVVLDSINQNPGGGNSNAYTATFQVNSNDGTGGQTLVIRGQAPSVAYTIAVDNHPEAVLRWDTQTNFKLSDIILKTGTNNFVLRMIDRNGAQIGSQLNYSVNKGENAAPFMKLEAEPDNLKLGETLMLDASASYDPDNNAVTFTWSSSPSITLTPVASVPANSVRSAVFTTPGLYSFTVQGNDGTGSTSITRDVAVANTEDFEPFTIQTIDTAKWTIGNIENRDSSSASKWYSLYDKPGSLVMQVLDDNAKPLDFNNAHPTLLRNMPVGDCTLLTEVTLETRQRGTFFTGLYIETSDGDFAFGLDNGTQISVKRSTGGGFTDIASPQGSLGDEAKLRIRRVGNTLNFERKVDGVWSNPPLFTYNLPGGATLSKGGIFLATSSAENTRVSFDYIMVVDPTNIGNSVFNNLRITELMYNPRGDSETEYIEVKNIGGANIDLNGVKIDTGITMNITTSTVMTPGEVGVFTKSSALFTAQFPGVRVLKQWEAGSLDNSGERIILKDSETNVIHNFVYDNDSPWPTYADGQGGALEVISTSGNYSSETNWRSTGAMPGGGTDTDGDGVPDAWEAKFGTSTSDPLSKPRATTAVNGSNQTQISWGGVSGQNYRVQYCDNLGDPWQTVTGANSVPGVNGTVSFTDPQLPRPTKRFYRIMGL